MDKTEKNRITKALENELDKLKKIYNKGYHLKLFYLPTDERKSEEGLRIFGEIQNGTIIIYEQSLERAIEILCHEYIEYIIKTEMENYLIIINKQKEIIEALLYRSGEGTVNTLVRGLKP